MSGVPHLHLPTTVNYLLSQSSSLTHYQQKDTVQLQMSVAAQTNAIDRSAIGRAWCAQLARDRAEDAGKILARIAFWNEFGPIAKPVVSYLAARLEEETDKIERFIGMTKESA